MDLRARKLLAVVIIAVLVPVAFAMGAARKAPNLKVASAGPAPKSLKAGTTLAVTAKVRNAGNAKAKATRLALVLSADAKRDAADTPLTGVLAVKALAKGKTATAKGKLTVPKAAVNGAYTLLACADAGSAVKEANEADNCRAVGRVTVTGGRAPAPTSKQAPAGKTAPASPAPAGPPPARPSEATKNIPPAPGTKPGNPDDPKPPPADPVPLDPAKVAPKLDPGASTSVYDATKFLFSGDNPIQRGVADGAIDSEQVSVLKGRVTDRDGKPITGVRVSVLDRPELGMTNTRASGEFDMAVNGGEIVLEFEIAGFLPVQRTLAPDWQDYESIGDVVMVPVDPNVEVIDPDSTAAFQVVEGSKIDDVDGERQGTLLFEKGTEGVMELPDGSTKPLDDMSVRVTEFTFGNQGDEAMPGSLPQTTGYTYAAEFSVDEALKAGATEVRFDKPVINYTENFIGAPVGSPVPTGYYDREKADWIPSENGRVIKVVNEVDGKAGLDVDGDGTAEPESSAKLTELGIDAAELKKIADLYNPGQELWRVLIKHFTPWDHNWPFGPPPGARPPKLKEFEWKDPNDPCQQKGSAIGCETQTLSESVPVAGTGMAMSYSTDRVPAWKVDETIDIPITGADVPPRLKGIQLLIDVAGERIEKRWCDPSAPTHGTEVCNGLPAVGANITHKFRWDGLDAYDRKIQGRITATIRVLYIYEFNYYNAPEDFSSSFSQFGSDTEVFDGRGACGNRLMGLDAQFFCGIPVGQTITRAIGSWDARPTHALGGWSLSEHHAYDPMEKALHLGDGSTIRGEALPPAVHTIAGTTRRGVGGGQAPGSNFPYDGEPATEANLDYLTEYTRAPDGNLYLHNSLNRNHIFRVSPDDKVSWFAGNGTKDGVITGDGGPAKSAGLGTVTALAAAPDGSLLISGYTNTADLDTQTIRRVSRDGSRIQTIAGNTDRRAPLGDGKPALEAHVGDVRDMIVGADGSIYWVEEYSSINSWKGRVRRIGTDGIVSTVVGAGELAAENGNPARDVKLGGDPRGLAMGPDGSIYVTVPHQKKVIRVAPDGRVYRFAGKGDPNERGEVRGGSPAAQSYIDSPYTIAVSPTGVVYIRVVGYDIQASNAAILRVNGEGIVEHYAGRIRGTCGRGTDGEAAASVCMQNHAMAIGVDGDGGLTFADGRYLIRKVMPPLPGFESDTLAVPSRDGGEVYEFDAKGRHLRTKSGTTGTVLRTFEYDGEKRLTGIVDPFGNRTTVERDGAGKPVAIVAPGGQRTQLGLNAAGFVESITNPANETHKLTYHDAGGLLATFERPEGAVNRFDYDPNGRLVRHRGADGDERTLVRKDLEDGTAVEITTKGGRKTTYSMQVLPSGDRTRTVEFPSGEKSTSLVKVDGTVELTDADGTKTTSDSDADIRWGQRVPSLRETLIETPAGKKLLRKVQQTVSLRNAKDPFSVNWLRLQSTESTPGGATGKTSTWEWSNGAEANLDDQTVTVTSAQSRSSVSTLDRWGRVTKISLGRLPDFTNVAPIEFTYDDKGRLKTQKQGAEVETLTYDARNRVISRENAAGHRIEFTYDDADRVLTRTLPGNKTYRYEYDKDGVMTKLTTPRGKVHTFDATTSGRTKSYTPPSAASEGPTANPAAYVKSYSTDKDLESIKLPSGALQDMELDTAGRLKAEDHVESKRTFEYVGVQDKFDKVTRTLADGTRSQSLSYGYDGALPASLTFSGAADGLAEFTFGDRMLPTQEKLTVGSTVLTKALEHDGDRLRTKDGPFTIERNGPQGAVSKISNGTASSLETEYDANGRPMGRKLTVGGVEKFFQKITLDNVARPQKREERVAGAALDTLTYEFDAIGQLRKVKRGTEVLEDWTYDDGGNRLASGAAYDDQDRLTALGGKQYRWDADGYLVKRGTDTFTWSRNGELLSATVGGATTTYAYDAFGRRTARTDANGTTKYLYTNPGNVMMVTATVSGSGEVTTYFYDQDDRVYAAERGGVRYLIGSDAVGSPRIVVKESDGSVVRRVDYDSFGVERNATGSFDLPIGYAGGLRDASTGFVRFWHRDYDPAAGRFVARDPSFFRGSPENLYTYTNNNPITQKDPTGLACGGFSGFVVFGGGFQFCRDNKEFGEDAPWSFCGELGVGKGGGWEADMISGAQDAGNFVVAEATGKFGPIGGSVGGEVELDCMNAKATAKVTAGPVAIGVSTAGEANAGLSSWDNIKTNGKFGGKLEAKATFKKCWKFGG